MIVDTHVHMWSKRLLPARWIESMAHYGCQLAPHKTMDEVKDRMDGDWFDESGDLLISDMDATGIDKSVVFILDFGLYAGVDDDISLYERYKIFHQAAKRHPGRLVLFGGIDPRRPDAPAFIKRAVEEFDMRGIKIWPPVGIQADEVYCYRTYETCARLGLSVVVHTGPELPPQKSATGRSIFIDQPANDFPELNFVLAHAGMALWEEAAELAFHHENVYLDLAYWQGKYLRSPQLFFDSLRGLIRDAGKKKVMYGSDWPTLRRVSKVRPERWMEILRGLPTGENGGHEFTQEEVDLMLGGNAERVLNLA